MPISLECAEEHISNWSSKFSRETRRRSWPKYLFHACDLSVAQAILEEGKIKSRADVVANRGVLIHDVANQGAVNNNVDAHDFARLYFRPRNSYHLKTEGIKSQSDPYRAAAHMNIPVMFVFPFEVVMTRPETRFLAGNFALTGAAPSDGDAEFSKIDFSKVYHDSAPPREQMAEIQNYRMSEVVVRGGIDLSLARGAIVRNHYDSLSLDHVLGRVGRACKIFVDTNDAIFFKWGLCISDLELKGSDVFLAISGPSKSPQRDYNITVHRGTFSGGFRIEAGKRYRIETDTCEGDLVRIEIEGCLAFEGEVPSGESEVV